MYKQDITITECYKKLEQYNDVFTIEDGSLGLGTLLATDFNKTLVIQEYYRSPWCSGHIAITYYGGYIPKKYKEYL